MEDINKLIHYPIETLKEMLNKAHVAGRFSEAELIAKAITERSQRLRAVGINEEGSSMDEVK